MAPEVPGDSRSSAFVARRTRPGIMNSISSLSRKMASPMFKCEFTIRDLDLPGYMHAMLIMLTRILPKVYSSSYTSASGTLLGSRRNRTAWPYQQPSRIASHCRNVPGTASVYGAPQGVQTSIQKQFSNAMPARLYSFSGRYHGKEFFSLKMKDLNHCFQQRHPPLPLI